MNEQLISQFEACLGSVGVLTGDDVRSRKASWLSEDPCEAMAIVRPSTTDEVAAVMRLCFEADQPIIPLGGNTGLVEGTRAGSDDVMLSLERMNRIQRIDAMSGTAVVEAGVALQTIHEHAEAAGMLFPLDLGARGSATAGGTIATNAGGNAVIRYGMMREQVLGLEAVLADGTVVSSMNEMLKNNAGYDLKQLFIGTEGTLGIVTRAVLRLRPDTPSRNTAMVAVDTYDKIPKLLREVEAGLGGTLSAFEVLWKDFFDTVVVDSSTHAPPVEGGFPFYVLIEARGGDQAFDEERFHRVLESAFEKDLVADAAIANSGAQRQAMWAIRDDIDGLVAKLAPAMAFDVSLPITHANDYTSAVHRRLDEAFPGVYRGTTFGHLGDSNVHFMLTVGTSDHAAQRQAMKIVYEELQPFGGSISAEHGIGTEKREFLGVSRNETEIELMRTLKQALDPKGLLNPGKVI